jgi:hypothetical protein
VLKSKKYLQAAAAIYGRIWRSAEEARRKLAPDLLHQI